MGEQFIEPIHKGRITRRSMIAGVGALGAAAFLAACGSDNKSSSTTAAPGTTAGGGHHGCRQCDHGRRQRDDGCRRHARRPADRWRRHW